MYDPTIFTAEMAMDPTLTPELQADIAQSRPDLLVYLATNPAIYPELRQWLGNSPDPAVAAALAQSAQAAPNTVPAGVIDARAEWNQAQQPSGLAGVQTQYAYPNQQPIAPVRTRKRGLIIGLAVGLVAVLVLGGIFAVKLLTKTGAASPQAVADQLSSAIDNKDAVSLAKLIAPSEYGVAQRVQKANDTGGNNLSNLSSADLLAEYADAITINESLMEYTITEKSGDITVIDITSWQLNASANVDQILDAADKQYSETAGSEGSLKEAFLAEMEASGLDYEPIQSINEQLVTDQPLSLVSVREGGSWYISPIMTAGENITARTGVKPNYAADYQAGTGGDSPAAVAEGTITTLVEAVSEGGVNPAAADAVFSSLTLPERRAAKIYALPAISQAYENVSPTLADLDLTVELAEEPIGSNLAVVSPDQLTLRYLDDWGGGGRASFNGWNLTVDNGYTTRVDLGRLLTNPARLGIVTEKVGGDWYVSLLGTAANVASVPISSEKAEMYLGTYLDELMSEKPMDAQTRDAAITEAGPALIMLDVMLQVAESY